MYKVTYSLGRINRYLNLKFSVILNNSKNMDAIRKSNFNGNQYLIISGLFPSITMEIIDEVKDVQASIWNTNRTVSINKFQMGYFVDVAEELIQEFTKIKELFGYTDGQLVVDKDIAWKIRKVMQTEYGKTIMLMPSVVEDADTHVRYEGVSFMINELSNYAMLTYQEFQSMIRYLKHIDFDTLAIQLLNTALLMRPTKEPEIKYVVAQEEKTEIPKEMEVITKKETESHPSNETVEWRAIPDTKAIPDI